MYEILASVTLGGGFAGSIASDSIFSHVQFKDNKLYLHLPVVSDSTDCTDFHCLPLRSP